MHIIYKNDTAKKQFCSEYKKQWSIRLGNTGYRVTMIPCDDYENEIVEGDIIAQCKMIKIIKLWIVTYVSDFKILKAKFYTYDDNGKIIYKIETSDGFERRVTKEEGNNYFMELMNKYEGMVNRII